MSDSNLMAMALEFKIRPLVVILIFTQTVLVRNRFLYNGQGTAFSNQSRVYPETDNAVDLGSSGNRYDDVYATNGTIQTSDSRLKQEVVTSVLGIDFIKALRPVSYKWIEGKKVPIVDGTDENGDNIYRTDADGNWVYQSRDGSRRHWGFIARKLSGVDDAVLILWMVFG